MDRLLAAARPFLLAIAYEYADPIRASQSASDLVQEAELRAWKKLEQFCGGDTDEDTLALFYAWVAQILKRLGVDAVRHHSTQRRKAPRGGVLRLGERPGRHETGSTGGNYPPSKEPTPSAKLLTTERSRLVREALEEIPDPSTREIVRLRFFSDMSLRQISEKLGIGYETTKDRYRRGMDRLERKLGNLRG
jgi:RNA polymerase sigma factor (sigma-70 family)